MTPDRKGAGLEFLADVVIIYEVNGEPPRGLPFFAWWLAVRPVTYEDLCRDKGNILAMEEGK